MQVSGLHSAWSLTAKPLSSMQNCLKWKVYAQEWAICINIGHGNQDMVYLRCSYFQTPSSCVSGAVRITSTSCGSLSDYNLIIIKQFWKERLESTTIFFDHHHDVPSPTFVWSAVYIAEQQGWSPSRQKVPPPIVRNLPFLFLVDKMSWFESSLDQWRLIPGRFRRMITVPEVDPSPIFVIITVINRIPREPSNFSEMAPFIKI